MKTIDPIPGANLYDVLTQAVEQAPARFTFNNWTFETRDGETLGDARQRFKDEHGFEVKTRDEMAEQAARDLDKMWSDQAAAIAAAKVATEAEMRAMTAPWPKTTDVLVAYINSVVDRPHDYGTCVYAMSLAAVAAFHYAAGRVRATGFQASLADLDILRQTRDFEWGTLLAYEKLLYPQYLTAEYFPSWQDLLANPKVKKHLAELAREKLDKHSADDTHPSILAHWERLAEAKKETP